MRFAKDLQRSTKTWTPCCFDPNLQHRWQQLMHIWTSPIGWIYKSIRKEQLTQLIDGRNTNEVTTKPWNKNILQWYLDNTIGIDHFCSTRWIHKTWCRMITATMNLVAVWKAIVEASAKSAMKLPLNPLLILIRPGFKKRMQLLCLQLEASCLQWSLCTYSWQF